MTCIYNNNLYIKNNKLPPALRIASARHTTSHTTTVIPAPVVVTDLSDEERRRMEEERRQIQEERDQIARERAEMEREMDKYGEERRAFDAQKLELQQQLADAEKVKII